MSVTARVRCEIEVPVGTWGESASFAEIKEQVRKEGENIAARAAKSVGGVVCGRPSVAFILMDERPKGGE